MLLAGGLNRHHSTKHMLQAFKLDLAYELGSSMHSMDHSAPCLFCMLDPIIQKPQLHARLHATRRLEVTQPLGLPHDAAQQLLSEAWVHVGKHGRK